MSELIKTQTETIELLLATQKILGHDDETWFKDHKPRPEDAAGEYAYVMNWIAQAFTLRAQGDVAAVASVLKVEPSNNTSISAPGTANLGPSTRAAKANTTVSPSPVSAATTSQRSYSSAVKGNTTSATVPNQRASTVPKGSTTTPPASATSKQTSPTIVPANVKSALPAPRAVVKLLVSNNEGMNYDVSDANYSAFSTDFIAVLNDKIQKDGAYYRESKEKRNKGVTDLVRVVVKHGWPRVSSKLVKIKETIKQPRFSLMKTLDSLVGGDPGTFGKVVETDFIVEQGKRDQVTANYVRRTLIPALKGHIALVENVNTNKTTIEDKMKILCDFCKSSKHIVQFLDGVLSRREAAALLNEDSRYSMKRLRRRLWRVLRYIAGPQKFLLKAIDIIKQMSSNLNAQIVQVVFEVDWIAKSDTRLRPLFDAKIPSVIPCTKTAFKSWFNSKFPTQQPEVKNNRDVALQKLDKVSDKSWKPVMHCEITLLIHLYKDDTEIICDTIGVSKLNCFACNLFVEMYKGAMGGTNSYKMSGTSGKAHHQWRIPNPEVFADISELKAEIASKEAVEKIQNECGKRLREYLQGETDRRNSVGSDSSTGSVGGTSGSTTVEFWYIV